MDSNVDKMNGTWLDSAYSGNFKEFYKTYSKFLLFEFKASEAK